MPLSPAEKLRLPRVTGCSRMVSSVKIGSGALSLSPAEAQWRCR